MMQFLWAVEDPRYLEKEAAYNIEKDTLIGQNLNVKAKSSKKSINWKVISGTPFSSPQIDFGNIGIKFWLKETDRVSSFQSIQVS